MADTINVFTTCPDCDDELLLPAIAEDQDSACYDQELSEVSDLYIRPSGAPDIVASFATTPTYVADSIDNTVTDNSKSKHLVGIGTIAEPTTTELQYPKQVTKDSEGLYTLEFIVPHLSEGGYELLLKMQCGWTDFTFYYADLAKFLYGKQGGIVPVKVKVVFPKGSGTARNQGILRISWKAYTDPVRKVNPIA